MTAGQQMGAACERRALGPAHARRDINVVRVQMTHQQCWYIEAPTASTGLAMDEIKAAVSAAAAAAAAAAPPAIGDMGSAQTATLRGTDQGSLVWLTLSWRPKRHVGGRVRNTSCSPQAAHAVGLWVWPALPWAGGVDV